MIYEFDGYALDEEAFEIRYAGEGVPAEPQVLELLLMLIRNRGRIVTKDELLEEVWKGRFVSDSALSSRVKSARKLIGDDGAAQRVIRTIHGRGFRFVAEVRTSASRGGGETARPEPTGAPPIQQPKAPASFGPAFHPRTRYARSGDVHIAYHLFGDGPADIVLAPGFISHVDNCWDDPHYARFLNRLGGFARVAMFDKRGTGLSDRVHDLPGMDERMDDVRAVMDAAGFDRAAIMGVSEGGSLACLFAAHHPERSSAMVLYGAFARFASWFPTEDSLRELFDYIETDWGTGKSLPSFAPGMADDGAFRIWWGKFERLGANPGAAIVLMRMNSMIDISGILPTIRVPTLVIHRAEDVLVDVEGGRYLAEHIPGARYVELPGKDHLAWVGENSDRITDLIAEFLTGTAPGDTSDRVLATVLISDIVGSTARATKLGDHRWRDLLDAHNQRVRREFARFRGHEVKSLGDGFLATFDGPARAIRCALAIVEGLNGLGLAARVGLHTGEVDFVESDVRGIAVHMASRIADLATAGEVVVSRTVKDLVAGSGLTFEDRGIHAIEGIADEWQLYRAGG